MTNTVIANGHTYTDDADPNTGMGNGGFRVRLLPMLSDVMHDLNASLTTVTTGAASAAASAASALLAPGTNATSSTAATIATGPVTLIIQTGKTIPLGASMKWANTAAPSNWGHGDVTAYNSGTGSLTINTQRIQGSGTASTWTVSLSGPAFADGAIGGSYVSPLAGDLALSASGAKLLSLTTAGNGGIAAIMPDATTLATGPFALAAKNNGPFSGSAVGYDIPFKDHAANLLGFLPPAAYASFGLADNTTAAGQWISSGLSPIGELAASKLVLASACGGTGGTWTKNVTIDSTHTLILIYGTSLHAVIYDSSAKQFGAPVLLRATLSTTGVDATVAAILVAANSVLVHSVPDNGTSLQTVVLSTSGTTITPGTMVPTTLVSTSRRIVDLVAVGSAYLLAYLSVSSVHTIATTVTGTVPVLGNDLSTTTSGAPAILPVSSTVFMVVTINSGTAITATAYSLAAAVQTLGSSAAAAISRPDPFSVRQVATGNWCISYINTTAKGNVLSCSGTTPAFGTPVTLSSLVTSITSFGVVTNLSPGSTGAVSSAVSGTDSAGRFVTEFTGWGDSSSTPGTPGLIGSIVAKGFAAIQTVVAVGNTGNLPMWAVTSAQETTMLSFSYLLNSNLLTAEFRMNAVGNFAQELSSVDALYPKWNTARNTLGIAGTTSVIGVTDGSQPSLRYLSASSSGFYIETLARAVNACADVRFASKGANESQAWLAFNQAPDTSCTIQLLGVA